MPLQSCPKSLCVNTSSILNAEGWNLGRIAELQHQGASVQDVGLGVHARLPGVARHVGHGDEEQGHAAQDEQGEGGTGAREGPGVVVLNPDGLVAGDHALDRLAHHLHRNDDAEAWEEHRQRRHCSTVCRSARELAPVGVNVARFKKNIHIYIYILETVPLRRWKISSVIC